MHADAMHAHGMSDEQDPAVSSPRILLFINSRWLLMVSLRACSYFDLKAPSPVPPASKAIVRASYVEKMTSALFERVV